jgi:hypothetical protein
MEFWTKEPEDGWKEVEDENTLNGCVEFKNDKDELT